MDMKTSSRTNAYVHTRFTRSCVWRWTIAVQSLLQQLPAKDACFTTHSFNFFQDSYLCSNVGLSMWILGWNCERRSYLTACRSPRLVPVIRGSSMTERKSGTTLSFTMSRSLGQGSWRRPHLTPRLQAALRFDVLEVALALRVSQRSHGLTGSQDLKISSCQTRQTTSQN